MTVYTEIMENYANLPREAFKIIESSPTMKEWKMKKLAEHFLSSKVFPNRYPYSVFAKRMSVTALLEVLSMTAINDPEHKGLLPYYARPSLLQYCKNDAERSTVDGFMMSLK